MGKIKNVVFDLGNVLVDFNPTAYLIKEYENFEDVKVLFYEVFKSREWQLLDQGAITDKEAYEAIVKRIPDYAKDVEKLLLNWEDFLIREIKESTYFLKKFKAMGLGIYGLSNYPERGYKATKDKFDFFKEFDGIVVSYEEGVLKPDHKLYEVLFERYNLDPRECIFIDDTMVNVSSAREQGMMAVHYRTTDEFMEVLRYIETSD